MDEPKAKPKRVTLTKDQIESAAGAELLELCQEIAEDGRLTDVEIGELKQWVARHQDAGVPAIEFLSETIKQILEDGVVTATERSQLHRAVERVLPSEARKQAVESRKQRQLADAAERAEVKHFFSKVSGVTFKNPDGTDRQRIVARCHEGDLLLLEREPDNKYDPRAVSVLTQAGEQIGYLSSHVVGSETYRGVAQDMDDGRKVEARIAGIGFGEESGNFGVRIELAYWNGPLANQPDAPYFPPAPSPSPESSSRQAVGRGGCLGSLAALASAISLVLFAVVLLFASSSP